MHDGSMHSGIGVICIALPFNCKGIYGVRCVNLVKCQLVLCAKVCHKVVTIRRCF